MEAALLVIFALVLAIVFNAVFTLIPATILFYGYNLALAPLLDLKQATFLQAYLLTFVIVMVLRRK